MKVFVKLEAEIIRLMYSNAQGRDLTTNTGRKLLADAKVKTLQTLVSRFKYLPETEYLTLVAHCLASHA